MNFMVAMVCLLFRHEVRAGDRRSGERPRKRSDGEQYRPHSSGLWTSCYFHQDRSLLATIHCFLSLSIAFLPPQSRKIMGGASYFSSKKRKEESEMLKCQALFCFFSSLGANTNPSYFCAEGRLKKLLKLIFSQNFCFYLWLFEVLNSLKLNRFFNGQGLSHPTLLLPFGLITIC